MSTIQRITGTNSGLDVDALVKSALTTQQNKIDKQTQDKKILEYQQEQYKQIMSDASGFYDKYFDILKTGNFMSTSTYQTESFTSSDNGKVTAKGFAGASVEDYTVNVTQLAAKASITLADGQTADQTMTFGSGANLVTLDAFAVGSDVGKTAAENAATTIANYNAKIIAKKAELNSDLTTADAAGKLIIQQQLKSLNVTATYSEFNKGIVFTANQMDEGGFTLNGDSAIDKELQGTITKGESSYTLTGTSNIVTVDNVQFTFKGVTTSTSDITKSSITSLLGNDITKTSKEYTLTGNSKITIADDVTTITKDDGTTLGVAETMLFTTTGGTAMTIKGDGTFTISAADITTSSITDLLGDNITTTLQKDGGDTEYTITNGVKITIASDGTKTIKDSSGTTLNPTDTMSFTTTDGTTMTIKGDGTFTSNITTSSMSSPFGNDITKTAEEYTLTDNSKIKIADDGTTTITKADETTLGANESMEFTTIDGSKMTIKGDGTITTNQNQVTLTGKTDVTELKDKIVSFVNDYNTLIQGINKKLYENRDKDYMPLTDAQKEAMTEDQITAWEKKAQTGLLRKDSDLERITNAMKSAMSSVMSGSGSYLESIGITPVKDYTDKNGMFTVDESKLTQALEENAGNVKDLFTRESSTTDNGGVLTQLKSALYNEFKTSTSSLAKKVGLVGSSTEYNNTLTNNIYKKKLLIADLNSSLSDKEDSLYKKYSNLETALQTLNSQQASLSSMLGQG